MNSNPETFNDDAESLYAKYRDRAARVFLDIEVNHPQLIWGLVDPLGIDDEPLEKIENLKRSKDIVRQGVANLLILLYENEDGVPADLIDLENLDFVGDPLTRAILMTYIEHFYPDQIRKYFGDGAAVDSIFHWVHQYNPAISDNRRITLDF